jgi:sulfhydrogenase subunit alpha
MKGFEVNVHHLTRVEGHGNIVVNVKEGKIEELRLEIVESPRFFEKMLQGRRWDEAPAITSRICGICALGHTTAAVLAVEAATGIVPDEETVLLRKLLVDGETIQSHILHTYFLVAPDILGVGSVIPLAETHPEVVKRALRLKKLGNAMCDLLVGRKVHPISYLPGGFTRWPSKEDFSRVREMLLEARGDIEATIDLFAGVKLPDFRRETEFLALKTAGEYALYTGDIASTLGKVSPPSSYLDRIHEVVVPHSAAKHVKADKDAFAVGALARFNVNAGQLRPWAAQVAAKLALKPVDHNPFHNNLAQVVETVHCYEDALELADTLSKREYKHERKRPVRFGRGVGATEVPRGTLYHDYTFDSEGYITKANCIIPTGQNLYNIEKDMEALVPKVLDMSDEKIRHSFEMLVRAYDPCISCATHFLDVQFIR